MPGASCTGVDPAVTYVRVNRSFLRLTKDFLNQTMLMTKSSPKHSSAFRLAALVAAGIVSLSCGPSVFAQDSASSALQPGQGLDFFTTPAGSGAPLLALGDAKEAGMSSSLPDSPDASIEDGTQAAADRPSKRIFGIIPNYRSVAVGAKLPPQTVHQKFSTAFSDTVDPAAFVVAGLLAGYNDARRATPEFHGGAVAYGRYYWHSLADQTMENIMVEFVVPSLAHEDTRYYTLGRGGAAKRLTYALSRPFITRSDAGKKTINLGELVGAGVAAGISSRYYPASQRDVSSVLQSYGVSVGIDVASFVLREFDSDISRMFSRKH